MNWFIAFSVLVMIASCVAPVPHGTPKPIQSDEPQLPTPPTQAQKGLPKGTSRHDYVKGKLDQAQDQMNKALQKDQK